MKFATVLAALITASAYASQPPIKGETVEVTLIAKKTTVAFGNGGVEQTMFTYNGTVPGPTIEANVGDTLRVHFTNELDMDTTVHWHGLEVPATMDGTPLSQSPVKPGKSFKYEFELRRAATYWYHPHIMSDIQTDMGLYGALIVRDNYTESHLLEVDHVAILDDVLLGTNGKIAPHHSDPSYGPKDRVDRLLNGKIGNTRLVNGDIVPSNEMNLEKGMPFITRFINVANALFFRLSFPGHTVYRIGSDGGLVESPSEVLPIQTLTDEKGNYSDPDLSMGLLLTPGERAVVWVYPNNADQDFVVEWHDLPVGRHEIFIKEDGSIGAKHNHEDGRRPKETIIQWDVVDKSGGGATETNGENPPSGINIETLVPPADAPLIKFELGHGAEYPNGEVSMFAQIVDGDKLAYDNITPQEAPSVTVGDVRYIDVANLDGFDHNWHLHGFHFQLINITFILKNGTISRVWSPPSLMWKDTVWMPRRPEAGGRTVLRLAAQFGYDDRQDVCAKGGEPSEDKSGGWLAHCHMLEHGESGMMSYVQVTGCKEGTSRASAQGHISLMVHLSGFMTCFFLLIGMLK